MSRYRRWLISLTCFLLVALTWAVFAPALTYPFLNLDDPDYVLKNPHVARGLTTADVAWAFTHVHASNWHPLTWISHMLDVRLFGLNPRGHHFTSVLIHSANVVLLFLVLRAMTGAMWRCALVAAIFAIHPLRAESVVWVAERKDVLSGFFFLLTLAAYVAYTRSRSTTRYALALLLFALGLLCKPMLVTLPVILVALDYWPLERWRAVPARRLILEKTPFFLLSLGASIATVFAQQQAMVEISHLPIAFRLGNAVTSCAVYLRQMFWPAQLSAFYPFPSGGVSIPNVLLSLVLLLGVSAFVFVQRRRRYLVAGWCWYLVMLAPVIGIIQTGDQAHADRYTYLPLIGISIALTWGVSALLENLPRLRAFLALAVVALLTVAARAQVSRWKNSETLWRQALSVTADNQVARRNLAHALYEQGRLDEAIANFERALAFDQSQPRVQVNLGAALLEAGKVAEATRHFETALALNPKSVEAESNMGLVLFEAGEMHESVAHLQKALALDPDWADAHYNLGNTFVALGRERDAIVHLEKAIELNRDDERALNNLAWLLATSPNPETRNGASALNFATRADKITDGKNQIIAATLAAAFAESGRFEEAIEAAQRAANLADAEGNRARADSIRAQLQVYREGKPYRSLNE